MRLLTFSFLKNCKFRTYCHRLARPLSAGPAADLEKIAEPSLVQLAGSWPADEDPAMREAVLCDMRVIPDFISEEEESCIMEELEPYLKRMRYEYDHWDNAIVGYRETERRTWSAANELVMARVRSVALRPHDAAPLPHSHVLDLAGGGHIAPHVDAVRFCGAVIAGLSLCSSAVMRLQHSQHAHRALDALLARRSLYIMRDVARYAFSHEVLGAERSAWRGERVARARRVAVICRTQPDPRDTR